MPPLRIVIDVRRLRDFGIGTYIRNLIRQFVALDGQNQYSFIALEKDRELLGSLPSNFEVVPWRHAASHWHDQVLFPLALRRLDPDVVHIPLNEVPLGVPKPYVVTVHDMSNLLFPSSTGMRGDLGRVRVRRGLAGAQCVIAVSAATKRDLEGLLNIPSRRIRVIHSAPDPIFDAYRSSDEAGNPDLCVLRPERQTILDRYQIDYPFLLYAGTIRPQKNIPRLVEAFSVLRGELEQHPVYRDLRLLIIGDEISHYPAVRHAVIQGRVERSVRFLGFVPIEALRIFYETASAFVFPSLYEGFGFPPLEAMASGAPVVTSSVSSLPEVVGAAAAIVNPENVFDIARGIREMLLDEDLRRSSIRRGFAQVKRFSWEQTAREVLAVYREAGGMPK